MIYLIGLISGIINGLFASGAGQILVFYLVFVLKIDTYLGRSVSISLICIASIFSFYNYCTNINIDIIKIFIVIIISAIFGYIGSITMKKIDSKFLNLFSGLIITIFSVIGMIKK